MAKLNLSQQQKQLQKLSPQQIQYIKLLQLPTLALEQRIKAEMEINPVLEEEEEEETNENQEETGREESDTAKDNSDDEFDWDDYVNNSDDLYGYKAQVDHSSEERVAIPAPYNASMSEYMFDQLGMKSLSEVETLIAEQIIGSIDDDGYLRRSLDAIADDLVFNTRHSVTAENVEKVLHVIQRLDPAGIGSRSLQECLLIQLELMPKDEVGRDDAIRMLRECYKAFTMKHFDQILTRLEIGESELKDAFDLIKRLNPKPGEGEFAATENYIIPDFTVEFVDDEFIISLNSRNAPRLRISRGYRDMWNQLGSKERKARSKSTGNPDQETKQFLKSKMESARWFINSIQQRRNTMLKVMHAIVQVQQQFFSQGEGFLKPMILKDIAELIDMDISTVSRVVSSKYVQTEFGVYSLKYFFSEGLTTDSGEEVSNREIKALIQDIVAEENKIKPLSDQRISDILSENGYNIARRTVTKYREQMNIPVARLRKQIVLDD